MTGTGVTTTPPDDSGALQTVQVRLTDTTLINSVPIMPLFGNDGALPVGTSVYVFFVGGDRGNGIIIGSSSPSKRRRGRQGGETGMHNAFGMAIALLAGGIVVEGGGKAITIRGTPKVRIEADLEVTGEVKARADGSSVSLSTHTHGDESSVTGPPTGGS